jgi:hypothetical protein
MKSLTKIAAAVAMTGAFAAPALALTTVGSFDCITNNSAASCSQAEAALSWSYNDVSNIFTISGASGFTGNVAEVYFDVVDGSGVTVSFSSGVGATFSAGANPGSLPGGNNLNPDFDTDFAFDSDGLTGLGISGGESASFAFAGGDFNLQTMTVGVHTRSLVGGESEGLVTVPAIPEPSTYALMFAGLAAVGFMARRRRQS